MRVEERFRSGDEYCAAWVVRPDPGAGEPLPGGASRPVLVLGHGLGGTRDMRLGAFAETFADAGYVCVVFDYRHFGDSGGEPRQVLDVGRQLIDWRAAVAFARSLPDVDPDRVVLWGSSFGGGHVLTTAAADPRIAAVIAQCPFTDGPVSALRLDPLATVRVGARALLDVVGSRLGRPPRMVALAGERGSAALMTAPDALPGYAAQIEDGTTFRNEVAARFVFQLLRYRPGRRLAGIAAPVLLCVCDDDTVAPAAATLRHARRAPSTEVRSFSFGHFGIYTGDPFAEVVAAQVDFLARRVPLVRRAV